MCSVLMSIRPEYVQRILSGKKIYEFRKKACKRTVSRMYIYSTVPVQKIVGEAEIEAILIKPPEDMWKLTHTGAGIEKSFFDTYYQNQDEAVAFKLINVIKYEKPKELAEMGIKTAPQSFQYIEE